MRGAEGIQEEYVTSSMIESILARVRSVGESDVAPDSVHQSVRRMGKRKSVAPAWPFFSPTNENDWFSKRAQDTIMARSPAPASVQEASRLIYRQAGPIGPHAHVQVPNLVDARMAIGTAAAGGPMAVNQLPMQEPFSVFLPPPFRIIFLIALGLLCWSANLRGLRRLGLDADGMMSTEAKVRVLPHHRNHGEQLFHSAANVNVHSSSASSRNLVGAADTELALFFRHPGPQETATFHLGLLCFLWATACWIAYRLYAFKTIFYGGDQIDGISNARGRHAQAIQGIAVLGFVAVACWPGDVLYRPMRRSLGRHLLKVCKPSLFQHIHFSDVVLADILTSYARVFGELWLTMCFLWPKTDTPAWWNGKGSVAVPLLVSLPYFIRFRQCLSEYNVSSPSLADGKRHMKPLFNAAKYASAFPVIWLSVLQGTSLPGDDHLTRANVYFYLWIGSVFINSLFSFWWDVTHDWGLELLRWETWANSPSLLMNGVRSIHRRNTSIMPTYMSMPTSSSRREPDASGQDGQSTTVHPNGVTGMAHERPHTLGTSNSSGSLYPVSTNSSAGSSHTRKESHFLRSPDYVMLFPPIVYQLAVTTDLVLRFAWSLKLSSHLHHIIELESTAFYLEALEILRRWAWTYLRIEWEACKRRSWEADGSMESLTLTTLRQDTRVGARVDLHHRD